MSGELAIACPQRFAPVYPKISRRLGESGNLVVHVEIDADGTVDTASIETGSGFERLDQAALAAIKTWRCNPPQRNGEPVRAIARQPFRFVLQGN